MSCSVLTSAAEPSDLPSSASSKPPNFIVILTDDQGYADVGFNGSQDIATPNIDRIADEGTRLHILAHREHLFCSTVNAHSGLA
ncbi:sulfatase-like hydrolase/transferase [Endozoicomonas atrinae]|uniref:sulfatase-like hydrolase/transferase n=1 Tax=Endozoicomonas atrinae TaxID=1333660 RepID=UPI003B001662